MSKQQKIKHDGVITRVIISKTPDCKECVHYGFPNNRNHDYFGSCDGCIHNPKLADYFTKKPNECPRCHGNCEVMVRDKAIEDDGSEDIGNTPYPIICPRCHGEGKI